MIDGLAVNGSAHSVGWLASAVRFMQTGMFYHYAMAIIIGPVGLFGRAVGWCGGILLG